ncbi:MAG: DUF4294 domain-containing protein [Bacteroidales bacterium]
MKAIRLFILTAICSYTLTSISQDNQRKIVIAKIVEEDTLIISSLPEYVVNARLPRQLRAAANQNARLVYNVKKAYPYAKLAGLKLREYEVMLRNAENEAQRRRLMKQAEDELRAEFEDDIKQLTFRQGVILIKLVDRETGNSSYVLIEELRGKFMAFFWQTFAKVFGMNLKDKYDPYGRDKDIEEIVVLIESGQI